LSTGDADSSARELSWVLEREPGQADARYNRALAYSAMGKNAEAPADLSVLIETGPGPGTSDPALPGLPAAQADPLLRSAVALAGLNTCLNGVMPPLRPASAC
jgi:hypothetical protein